MCDLWLLLFVGSIVLCSCVHVDRLVFFFKQKTAYEMRISDWSSDVCSSDLPRLQRYLLAGDAVRVAAALVALVVVADELRDAGQPLQPVDDLEPQIGRASCRERVCQYV